MPQARPRTSRISPLEEAARQAQAAASELLFRRKARRSLIQFCHDTYSLFTSSWHIDKLAHKLEMVTKGKIKRLIVTMPPRHGKSELCSIRWPAWHLGKNPQDSFIQASYAENLSLTFSRQCRDTIDSPTYRRIFPGVSLSVEGSVRWRLNNKIDGRASYIAAGVGGSISGEGANNFIIDDPIKNYDQAFSKPYRDKVWDWYRSVVYTRLQADSAIVVVTTRWHADDLAGRLLKEAKNGGEQWEVLDLPAEDLEGRVTGRKYTALWEDRFDEETLAKIKKTVGRFIWSALYQQQPIVEGGTVFTRDMFRFYRPNDLPKDQRREHLHVWDTAFEEKQENDYSANLTSTLVDADLYILDGWRGQVAFPDLWRKVIQRWRVYPGTRMLIENKGSGISLRQTIVANPRLAIPVVPMPANISKLARGHAVSGFAEAGKIYLPHPDNAPWVLDFLDEVCGYPGGAANDDWYDCLVHLMTYVYLGHTVESGRGEVIVQEFMPNYSITSALDDVDRTLGRW